MVVFLTTDCRSPPSGIIAVVVVVVSFAAILYLEMSGHERNNCSVLFVRRFRAPFFEQVVYALGVLIVTSPSDVSPVVKRRFRLFD